MCELCPVVGGAMKATNCGKWCHMICARWCPDPIGLNGGLLEGLSEVLTAAPVLICDHHIRRVRHGLYDKLDALRRIVCYISADQALVPLEIPLHLLFFVRSGVSIRRAKRR